MWAGMDTFPMTRDAALERLATLVPRLGRTYADTRNTARDLNEEATTSALSPYLRRRVLTEHEVAAAALAGHGPGAHKFVEEVFWRTYFKGHLETHPAIWDGYQRLVAEGRAHAASNAGLRRAVAEAEEGRTGIEGFDDWARELVAHNWLHNHARMWFASIWIFTLKLPWALGADFFMRHLLDADPASNTLSWRWVAGLHTRGKPYAARAENIRRYTDGRFDPRGLNENPVPLDEPPVPAIPVPPAGPAPAGEIALLLHGDDLHPESLPLDGATVVRVGGVLVHADGSVERVRAADRAAMADALARAGAHFGCPAQPVAEGWPTAFRLPPPGRRSARLRTRCRRDRGCGAAGTSAPGRGRRAASSSSAPPSPRCWTRRGCAAERRPVLSSPHTGAGHGGFGLGDDGVRGGGRRAGQRGALLDRAGGGAVEPGDAVGHGGDQCRRVVHHWVLRHADACGGAAPGAGLASLVRHGGGVRGGSRRSRRSACKRWTCCARERGTGRC